MANNPYVNKVVYDGNTLIDVSEDTVDEEYLLNGYTAHKKDGSQITGAVVTAPASDASPNMDGTASAGVASTYSRGDHVHPSDTSRQAKITASGLLKGDGSGGVTAAVAGTDYAAASHTQALSTITGTDDLQAIEALSGTSGLLKKTAANTWTLDTTTYIPASQKGANSGVAELDSSGKVPSSQLPSYVDDVLEYSTTSDFPATGETGKIYLATTTNLAYRWGGTEYVEISAGLALGETSSTAYRGDRGKTAYDHATDASRLTTAQNSGLYKIATTSEGHIASVTAVEKADITGLGIPAQDTTYVFDGTYNASTNKAATVSTVTNAINALDGGIIGVGSTNKTITSLSQTDGNVSATFDVINITKSQVSDFPTEMTPSSHVHGNITNDGDITTTATIAAGDRLVINDESESELTNSSITFAADKRKFLSNNGTWESIPIAEARKLGGIMVGNNLSMVDGVLSAIDTTYEFDGTYDASTNKAATVSTITNAINALDGGTIGTGSTTKTITSLSQTNGNVSATFDNIAFPVTSVNTKTGAVSLTASDVGALPDDTTIPQGTVTSVRVQATSPVQSSTSTEQSTTLNTTISLADGYGDTKNPYASKTKNTVLAAPSDANGVPSFRALVAADIPSITKSKISDFPTEMTPSSHTHGNITNSGDITTTSTIANGDRLVINDESASKVTNSSITFGTSETTFLTNKGTWATPSGTYSLPTASADTLGGIKVGANLSISDGVLSATDTTYEFDGTYNASTNKAATVSTVTNAINALDGGTIGTGSTTKTITALSQTNGNVSATFKNIAFPVTSVNTKTGAVSLTASDVGALPDTTEIPTATSDLTNDSNFVSDASYVHTDNNFTTTLKDKLDGIAAGATVDDHKWNDVTLNKSLLASLGDIYVPYLSSTTATSSSLTTATPTPTAYQIAKYNNNAYLSSTTPAADDSSTKVATTAFVSNAISSLGSVLDFKGTKETASQLPTTGNETGDVWIVTADSSEYVWDGTKWEKFGPTIDLSGYVPTSRTVNGKALSADISLTASDVGAATLSDISSAINALDGGTIGTGSTSKTITALSQSDGNVSATFNDIAIAWSQVTSGNDDLKAIENLSGTSGLLKKTAANTWSLDTTSYVPTSRKINTKALSADITLTASDVGALPDDTEIPSATSDLTNDSGFITSADVPVASSTSPKMDGTATVGTEAKWAHGDHIHPTDTSRQAKITASGILKGNGSGTISAAVAGTDYQAPLPSQTGNNGKYLTTNGTALSWGDVDALPTQTGQSGKYLTTNGTTASWATVNALPSQTGQSGKYLTTNGTSASWSSISIPTTTSDLTNDSGFITSADIPVTSVNTKTGDVVLTASDVGALPDSTIVPTINVVNNPALTASSGKFTWTISASSAGGDMNPNIVITIYELSTGAVVYPNIVVNQGTGNVTITINGTGTLAADTYKAVIMA